MKKTIIIVALIIIVSISTFAQMSDKKLDKTGKAKEQVTALVTEFANALVKGDTATLGRILSDDYGDASGLPTPKSLLIGYFKDNANNANIGKLAAIDLNDSFIRLYDNVAIVVVPAKVKWREPNNQLKEGNYMATLVAYNKKGRWQIVATHYSEFEVRETQPRQSQ